MVGASQNFQAQIIGIGYAVQGLAFLHRVVHPFPVIGPGIVLKTLASCKE